MDDVRERFQNLHEFIKVAKQNLNRNNFDYIVGATETETTLARNRASLDSIAFKPRVLRNVQDVDTSTELFVPLGIYPKAIDMVDYYPLIPWFGVVLLGIAVGKWIYPNGTRLFSLPDLGGNAISKALRYLGRNSLVVYLVHQPVLIGLLMAYTFIAPK